MRSRCASLTSTEHCQLGRAIGHSKAILTDFEEAGERLSSFCPPQTIRSAVQLEPDGDRHSEAAQMATRLSSGVTIYRENGLLTLGIGYLSSL